MCVCWGRITYRVNTKQTKTNKKTFWIRRRHGARHGARPGIRRRSWFRFKQRTILKLTLSITFLLTESGLTKTTTTHTGGTRVLWIIFLLRFCSSVDSERSDRVNWNRTNNRYLSDRKLIILFKEKINRSQGAKSRTFPRFRTSPEGQLERSVVLVNIDPSPPPLFTTQPPALQCSEPDECKIKRKKKKPAARNAG